MTTIASPGAPPWCGRRLAMVVCLLAGFTIPALAGSALDDLVHAGAGQNPRVQAARRSWEASRQKAGIRGALPDPMMGADFERNGTTFDDYMGIEYMVQQDLPWFGKRGSDRSVEQLLAEASGFEYLEIRRQVQGEIRAAWWELWRRRSSLQAARESLGLARQAEALAQVRQESGQALQTDLLRAQIEQVRMSNDVVSMEREAALALGNLNRLLAAEPGTPCDTAQEPRLPRLDASLEVLQARARQFSCILMATQRRAEAAAAGVKSARLEGRPTLQVRVEARQFKGGSGIDEYDTGIFMNFPWLWRGKYKAMAAEAAAERSMAEADYEEDVNTTRYEIQELQTMAENKLRTMELYESTLVPRARDLVASSRQAYEAGQMSAMELLDAQRMLQDTLMEFYAAKAGYAAAEASLQAIAAPWSPEELATGLPPHP